MRIRPLVLLAAVFGAAALATWFVVAEVVRDEAVRRPPGQGAAPSAAAQATSAAAPSAGASVGTLEGRIVLADGSKIGRVELSRLCGVDEVDMVITGESADAELLDALRERGCEVRVAR